MPDTSSRQRVVRLRTSEGRTRQVAARSVRLLLLRHISAPTFSYLHAGLQMTPGQCISDPGSVLPRIPGESVPSWGVRALRAAGLLPGPDDIVVSRELAEKTLRTCEVNGYRGLATKWRAALSQPHPAPDPWASELCACGHDRRLHMNGAGNCIECPPCRSHSLGRSQPQPEETS